MSEVLLQAIVEKLQTIEIALLKPQDESAQTETYQSILNQLKIFQSNLDAFSDELKSTNKKIEVLILKRDICRKMLDERTNSHIVHEHHLNKGLWISAALFIFLAILMITLINTRKDLKGFEAHDLKYRSLNLKNETTIIKALHRTDSLYDASPEVFKKETIAEETRMAERARLLMLAGEKEKEMKELRRRVKKR